MRIGELARAAGVSTRALRYYEEQGLLESTRSTGGQRCYADSAVERVRWIRSLYAAGLASRAIVGLLPCVHTGVLSAQVMAQLLAERDRIDGQVRDLTETRDRMDELLAAAVDHLDGTGERAGGVEGCTVAADAVPADVVAV